MRKEQERAELYRAIWSIADAVARQAALRAELDALRATLEADP